MEGGRKKKEDTRIKSLRISKGSFEPRVVNLSFPIEEKKKERNGRHQRAHVAEDQKSQLSNCGARSYFFLFYHSVLFCLPITWPVGFPSKKFANMVARVRSTISPILVLIEDGDES